MKVSSQSDSSGLCISHRCVSSIKANPLLLTNISDILLSILYRSHREKYSFFNFYVGNRFYTPSFEFWSMCLSFFRKLAPCVELFIDRLNGRFLNPDYIFQYMGHKYPFRILDTNILCLLQLYSASVIKQYFMRYALWYGSLKPSFYFFEMIPIGFHPTLQITYSLHVVQTYKRVRFKDLKYRSIIFKSILRSVTRTDTIPAEQPPRTIGAERCGDTGNWDPPRLRIRSVLAPTMQRVSEPERVPTVADTARTFRVYDVRACIRYYCFPLHRCRGKEKKWCSCVVGLRATREELWQQNEMIFRVPLPPTVVVFVCSSPSRGSASV
ncbi:hypothetical protein AGLY_010337 [Aphis glycines]|uniref:Uncharacterized protein n=1 Tax=Aphis glycines TaxID=307491 RepID=A0A6G0TG39_APHGL|nr:hypothetical protein AGLY_010337 [Aphis glycines]